MMWGRRNARMRLTLEAPIHAGGIITHLLLGGVAPVPILAVAC